MKRFRKKTTGLIISLSIVASVLACSNAVNAKNADVSNLEETDINEDVIEEDEINSKAKTYTDDELVKNIIPDKNLFDELMAKYNISADTANPATFTYSQLKTIIRDSVTSTSNIVITDSGIKSIEGLGLLRDCAGIDISRLTQVKEIPAGEFQDGQLKNFIMSDSIKVIGNEAFSGCKNLEEMILPSGLEELGDSAFANCSSLSVLGTKTGDTHDDSLPLTLTKVGSQVFTNNESLVSITIPAFNGDDSGKLLDSSSGLFYGCKSLTRITISDGIAIIPESAFDKAGSAVNESGQAVGVEITFPKSLSRIRANAFSNISLKSEDKTIDFTEMNSLVNIDSEAFKGAKNLERIILPKVDKLTFGARAFAQTSINKMYVKGTDAETAANKNYATEGEPDSQGLVYLPDSVEKIGEGCFSEDTNLKHISLSPNLPEIPDYAFDGCSELYDIVQRQDDSKNCKVTSLGDAAFRGTAIKDTEFLIKMNKLTDIGKQVVTTYTFKKGVPITSGDSSSEKEIESIPLGGAKTTDFVIKDGNKTFKNKVCGSEVFSRCKNLSSVHIPASVKTIASRAFYYSIATTNTDRVASGIKTIIWDSDDASTTAVDRVIYSGAFQGNDKLTNVILPYRDKDTLNIGDFAFACDSGVTSFKFADGEDNVFPNTVTAIGSGAFYRCKAIQSVSVQNTATGTCPEIGNRAFWGCTSLDTVVFPAAITEIPDHVFYNDPVSSFKIGDGEADSGKNVTRIGTLAFFGNRFKTIDISGYASLSEIGSGAFALCDLVLENDIKEAKAAENNLGWASNVTEYTLTTVILPDNNKFSAGTLFINTAVFAGHKKLNTIKTASIGENEEFYLPDYLSVKEGRALFAMTGVMKTVWQADTTGINQWTEIPISMYYNCKSITYATDVLPTGKYVTHIGVGAFEASSIEKADLSNYENLAVLGSGNAGSAWAPNGTPGVFYACPYLTEVKLPKSNAEEFVAGKYCFSLSGKLKTVDMGNVTKIDEHAFEGDSALATIVFPETLKEIGGYAFRECTSFNLTNDNNFPESLEKIGNYAFEKDVALSHVVFGSNLKEIGSNAFVDCTGLGTAYFDNATALEKINSSAFQNTGLRDFNLTKSKVQSIEGSVLKGCQKLESAVFGNSVTTIKQDALSGCPNFKSLKVAPTTVIDRKIFYSAYSVQETVDGAIKNVQKYTAENNKYSIVVNIDSSAEQKLPLGREFELPFYVNPKDTSTITSILIGEGSTDSSIQEMIKVNAKTSDGYYWGTTKDNDNTHKITSESYYNQLEKSETGKYNNMDVDIIKIETLKSGKFDLIVNCAMTFDCAKREKDSSGTEKNISITSSNVPVKFNFAVEEMKFHPVIYSQYTNNTYADEDKVSVDAPISIQAAANNSKGSTRYYYNMVSDSGQEGAITTYDIVAVSDNPEVIQVSSSSSGEYPEAGYETTNCTRIDSANKTVIAQNNNMNFYINPKKVGTATVTITAKGFKDKADYQTKMTFNVNADIENIVLTVPEQYYNGANVGDAFNVFSSYKNVLGQVVDTNNLMDMNVFSNNTIVYESEAPDYVTVDANGNVSIIKADNGSKSVKITAKTEGGATQRNATCYIRINGLGSGSSSGSGTGGNNNNNKNETPVNPDGTYDDKASKSSVSVNTSTGEATYVRPAADADPATVNIPATVKINGTDYKVTSFDASSITGNTTITKINLGNNITSIPNGTFAGCTALTSVSIPSSVTTIGNDAFAGCSSLTSVSIPSNVVVIGDNAFNGCSALKNISIPSSATSVGANTFANCTALTSVSLPSTLTNIGANAFGNCISLTGISVPATVTSIGDNAFKGCKAMTSATIGDGVKSIGSNAFNGCAKLTTVNISDNSKLVSIGANAFYNCKLLTSVTIPKKVKTIGAKAFYNCKKLQTINVKSTSLKKIGKQAFKNINKKAIINVPKKKYKKYKKLFKGKGQKKSVKMVKLY